MTARGRSWFLALGLIILLVAGCSTQVDTGRISVTVITHDRHVVETDRHLVGETYVIGGTMIVEEGAQHEGGLTVLAGEAQVAGRIVGDLTVLGGKAKIDGTAEITGDLTSSTGTVARAAGAAVHGQVSEESNPMAALGPIRDQSILEGWIWSLTVVGIAALLAWATARLAPHSLQRTAGALTSAPMVSGAMGLLVAITVLPLLASLIFTLVLIPVAGVIVLVLAAAAVHGLLSMGRLLGGRIAHRLGWPASSSRAAVLGAVALVVGLQLINLIPIVGTIVVATVLMVSLGAALLTGFGLRPYVPPTAASLASPIDGQS